MKHRATTKLGLYRLGRWDRQANAQGMTHYSIPDSETHPANSLRCARSAALRPSLLVARQAFNANARNCCSTCEIPWAARSSSNHPIGLLPSRSICRASLSPMGREDLTWLHMLGEICNVAAKDCSNPLGGVT